MCHVFFFVVVVVVFFFRFPELLKGYVILRDNYLNRAARSTFFLNEENSQSAEYGKRTHEPCVV